MLDLGIKAFHVIFMVTWFAGLFYLPRLFVYHTQIMDTESEAYERMCTMERKLFWFIMTPGGVLTALLGLHLAFKYAFLVYQGWYWLHVKMLCVLFLWIFHGACYKHLRAFQARSNRASERYFRFFNEIPSFFLILCILLVYLKPF